MLKIEVKEREFFNNDTNEFINIEPTTLYLEHSLVSVSKWESKYHKPFLDKAAKEMTPKEMFDYIKLMVLNKNIPDEVYSALTREQIEEIKNYIEDKQTATTFSKNATKKQSEMNAGRRKGEIITSEIIYYWMVELNIPFECQYWHLNRLMTLIQVCTIKNSDRNGNNKMNKRDAMAFNRSLMASRRAKAKGGH